MERDWVGDQVSPYLIVDWNMTRSAGHFEFAQQYPFSHEIPQNNPIRVDSFVFELNQKGILYITEFKSFLQLMLL